MVSPPEAPAATTAPTAKPGTVVIAGASGLVGGAAAQRFAELGWQVHGMSRRAPAEPVAGVEYHSVDLLDENACGKFARKVGPVTHLVYAAINETAGSLVESWYDRDHAGRNTRMLANLLDALLSSSPAMEHVTIVHGGKAYAIADPAPLDIPLRETLPRPEGDNFYFGQEDVLLDRAKGGHFSWTVLRAMIVVGGSRDSNLNGLLATCVLAALRRDAGKPLDLPAGATSGALIEMTDVDLLADGIAWASTTPEAANRIFNITNGDVFAWRNLWPVIADTIGVEAGDARSYSVRDEIAAESERWGALVRRHELPVPTDPFEYLGESAALADYALAADRSVVTSTIAIRQAGFSRFIDTASSVRSWINRWRDMGMLPPR